MQRSYQRAPTRASASAPPWLAGLLAVSWLCLCGESPDGSALPGARAQSAPASVMQAAVDPRCTIEQKKPLFVGFAPGMTLDAFEPAAEASREIWRSAKAWLCDVRAIEVAPKALAHALSQHASLRGEEVRFDDQQFQHAHVVLIDASKSHPQSGWEVHLLHGEHAWTVTHATEVALAVGAQRP